MKVAYINCLLSNKGQFGVERKLVAQAKAISLLGLDLDVFYLNFGRKILDSEVAFFERRGDLFGRHLSVLTRYSDIASHVDASQYDFLVLRYSGGDFSLFSRFFRENGPRIVTEHHTKELPEAFTYESSPPQKALTVLMEKYLGPRMIRRCLGLIGVTDEIRDYELQRTGNRMPACTVTNGVLVQDIPFSKHGTYNGSILRLVCLANAFEAWQGLDRVLAGFEKYTSRKPSLHLKVVGHVSPGLLASIDNLAHRSNVKVDFPGRLYGTALEDVLGQAHVAFSSLALFRKGMKEACALKTREFVARGLPFVTGYRDPDLEKSESFFLPVAGDNSPVDMDEVVSFAEGVLARKGISECMREYANERLDWKIKIQEMWNFLRSLRQEKHGSAR